MPPLGMSVFCVYCVASRNMTAVPCLKCLLNTQRLGDYCLLTEKSEAPPRYEVVQAEESFWPEYFAVYPEHKNLQQHQYPPTTTSTTTTTTTSTSTTTTASMTTSTSTTETTESSPDPPLPVNSSESSPPPNATSASSSTTAKPSEQKPAKQPPTKLRKAKEENREWYEIPWLWMVWGVAALFCCVCTCICYSMCCRRSVDPQNLDEPAFAPEFVNVEPMHHELGATEEALYCPRRSRTTWSIPTVISPSLTVDE
ncbi:unnamed protein product, partial [Mesorhabditis spiculigera]